MKYNSSLFSKKNNSLIHNKFILYFVLIISLADLFYLSVERDFISILSFILIGFLFSFFTKNMLIILFLALTLSNILKFGSSITREGFERPEELEIMRKLGIKPILGSSGGSGGVVTTNPLSTSANAATGKTQSAKTQSPATQPAQTQPHATAKK
jgi:hypothetical protein